jgi:uncharacterized membrane protein YhaH (DUF805 family)
MQFLLYFLKPIIGLASINMPINRKDFIENILLSFVNFFILLVLIVRFLGHDRIVLDIDTFFWYLLVVSFFAAQILVLIIRRLMDVRKSRLWVMLVFLPSLLFLTYEMKIHQLDHLILWALSFLIWMILFFMICSTPRKTYFS